MSKTWRQLMLTLSILSVLAVTVYAQPGGGRGGRGGPGGGGFGGGRGPGGPFGAMFGGGGGDARFALRSDVRAELDLSEKQIEEIEELQNSGPDFRSLAEDLGIDMRSMFRMSQEEREEALKPLMDKLAKSNKDANEELMDVLKSKQRSRFKELKFQFEVSTGNVVAALAAAGVDLKGSKQESLRDEMREANEELQKKIAALRKDMYSGLLAKFMDEGDIDKLMSDEFEFEQRAGFGGRGGGGRPGGGRPAGGGGNQRRPRRPGGEDGEDAPRNNRRRPN